MRYPKPVIVLFAIANSAAAAFRSPGNLARRQETFGVTSPAEGGTIPVGTSDENTVIPINWTVPSALRDRPVTISLMQGDTINSLAFVYRIFTSTPNNGSVFWRSTWDSNDDVLYYGYDASSGCNYTMQLRTGFGDVAYSGYFAVANGDENDPGIPSDAACPSGKPKVDATYLSKAGSTTSSSTYTSSSSTSVPAPDGTTAPSPSSYTRTPGSNFDGVSQTTLSIAVVIPIVVLLAAFGLVLFFGIRRGWFVSKKHKYSTTSSAPPMEFSKTADGHNAQSSVEPAQYHASGPNELHGSGRPYQADSAQMYQLDGREVRY